MQKVQTHSMIMLLMFGKNPNNDLKKNCEDDGGFEPM
jgi:hypothetical protein